MSAFILGMAFTDTFSFELGEGDKITLIITIMGDEDKTETRYEVNGDQLKIYREDSDEAQEFTRFDPSTAVYEEPEETEPTTPATTFSEAYAGAVCGKWIAESPEEEEMFEDLGITGKDLVWVFHEDGKISYEVKDIPLEEHLGTLNTEDEELAMAAKFLIMSLVDTMTFELPEEGTLIMKVSVFGETNETTYKYVIDGDKMTLTPADENSSDAPMSFIRKK